MDAREAARNALTCVLEARRSEKLTIVCDEVLLDIGDVFASAAVDLGLWTKLIRLPNENAPRRDMPRFLESEIVEGRSDIYVNLFKGHKEETPFRIATTRLEKRRQTRLGHCPGIRMDMLTKGALALSREQYIALQSRAEELMGVCAGATGVRIQTPDGTDLRFSVEGRAFFTDTKLDWQTLKWMNLPVGEVIVGPVESSAEGTLVCTTAVGGMGLLKKPITLNVKEGAVTKIICEDAMTRAAIEKVQSTDTWARRIGEFAFGLNPSARLIEEFLETEKMAGTVHVAFGHNADYPGGKNNSKTHQDFLMFKPDVTLDFPSGKKEILKAGKFVYRI